jgi:hypothetical protein
MQIDAVRICNRALGNLGKPSIMSLDEKSAMAKVCKQFYDDARIEALAAAPWPFAKVWATGVAIDIDPMPPWLYVFAYPVDALRVLYIQYDPKTSRPPPMAVTDRPDAAGKLIHTNTVDPTFVYVRDKEDVTTFDPLFIAGLGAKLTEKIAMPLTKNLRIQEKWEKRFMQLRDEAWATALNEGTDEDDTDKLGFYHEARFS